MEPLSTSLLIGIFEPVCFIKSMKTHACKYWWNHNFFFTRMWFYAFCQKLSYFYTSEWKHLEKTTEEVCLMQCSSPLWPGRIYFLCYTCRLDSAGGHDLSSISHRTVHGALQPYDWRTSHTTYRLLFLKINMSILKNLQERRPLIWIIYIFKEAILYKNYLIT